MRDVRILGPGIIKIVGWLVAGDGEDGFGGFGCVIGGEGTHDEEASDESNTDDDDDKKCDKNVIAMLF